MRELCPGCVVRARRRRAALAPRPLMSSTRWASQRISWYRGMRPYSRRELTADACIHGCGLAVSTVATCHLEFIVLAGSQYLPRPLRAGLHVYAVCFPLLWGCSAAYNLLSGHVLRSDAYVDALKLADHVAINLLIAGTNTPIFILSRCFNALVVVWTMAALSVAHKAFTRSEIGPAHVTAFLVMGWQVVLVRNEVAAHLTGSSLLWVQLGGAVYTGGLIPFAAVGLEFHTAAWHACVLAAGCCFHAVITLAVARPDSWTEAAIASWPDY